MSGPSAKGEGQQRSSHLTEATNYVNNEHKIGAHRSKRYFPGSGCTLKTKTDKILLLSYSKYKDPCWRKEEDQLQQPPQHFEVDLAQVHI